MQNIVVLEIYLTCFVNANNIIIALRSCELSISIQRHVAARTRSASIQDVFASDVKPVQLRQNCSIEETNRSIADKKHELISRNKRVIELRAQTARTT